MKADRLAALNMYANSGQTRIKRFRHSATSAPNGGGSGMPCGACQEFFYQLNEANEDIEKSWSIIAKRNRNIKRTYAELVGKGTLR